jgi:hypothetical protein
VKDQRPNDSYDSQLDDNDPVWRLLARAPLPEPEAWFTARTLARCRRENLGGERWGILSHRLRTWRWALGSGLGLCLAVVLLMPQPHSSTSAPNKKKVQEAFEIVASLGEDSDIPSSPWQDTSL